MALTIQSIRLQRIKAPLKKPFTTHLQNVTEREVLLVEVTDSEGISGYGECTAFSTPWYTEETVTGAEFVLRDVLIPLLEGHTLDHPEEVFPALSAVKGNRMAKAAVETAVWDLYARQQGMPLWQLIGGTADPVPAGVVVATAPEEMPQAVAKAKEQGYRRVKLKISRSSDEAALKKLCSAYPDLLFFADANGAFSEDSFEELLKFDACGFELIEQPFGEEEWHLHAEAERLMKTAVCLDESLTSYESACRMVEQKAGSVAVLKMSRLGGWRETLRVYELFKAHGIRMWVGGMIEFGVSKAHNLALASLPAVTLPGDFSASSHYWEQDVVEPPIDVEKGSVLLKEKPGIGYEVKFEG